MKNTTIKAMLQSSTAVLCAAASVVAFSDTTLTIYSKAQPGAVNPDLYRPSPRAGSYYGQSIPGYAIVRDDRGLSLARGRSAVSITDVAALLDPTTVRLTSLTDPSGTQVVEQDFRFDLVGSDKLLQRYIDQPITVEQLFANRVREVSGRLLSTDGGLVLQEDDGSVSIVREWQNIELGSLPGGLMTRPTLLWDINARRAGPHDMRLTYETQGMTWWADYNLTWAPSADDQSGTLDVSAWVSILNQTGTSFSDTGLKLVAGDVQRAQAPNDMEARVFLERAAVADVASVAGFDEKAFFEFHLYTLGRKTDLPDQSTKQMALFPSAANVPARKRLVFNGLNVPSRMGYGVTDRNFGSGGNSKVDVYLEFENLKKHGLGVPLPAGRIRVSQLDDADGSLEFVGEDIIEHTPKNEDIRIRLGSSFDVVGERKQVDYSIDTRAKVITEAIEITLTNRKDIAQAVTIAEPLYRYATWTISGNSDRYRKIDSRLVHFDIEVPPDSKKTVRYSVRYTW
ncbi:MAG: DUF4139 domain-containing protein [Pseudomonadota bacterium]